MAEIVAGYRRIRAIAPTLSPAKPEHLISSVNLRVEARGEVVTGTFRLLAIEKLESPELPHI